MANEAENPILLLLATIMFASSAYASGMLLTKRFVVENWKVVLIPFHLLMTCLK